MRQGIISSTYFTLGGIDFYIDLQDNGYYGKKSYKFYVPSVLNPDCFSIDVHKQFTSIANCRQYIVSCVVKTSENIIKETK